ncbi:MULTISPECIES: hypothetical protein [unclassified Cobetia]|uniref:hypothetical protein n=1 Tax=unclassified Cobetia TaxID=2609414 RepID=UPI0020971A06|nr:MULTISPECIES: hypothetical protein [unclassified Cobetia]MCO7231605.1 hypothetical protein [Cobetia sp. Dlab-2-AX]MCO7235080.1 hypothetical protein [Cobetia sp. Dlab-2-U]
MEVGNSVFSLFSGKEYVPGEKAELNTVHLEWSISSHENKSWARENPEIILDWITASFWYFRSMSAIPSIADAIWGLCEIFVDYFKEIQPNALSAAIQLALWDYQYNRKRHPRYLEYIKGLNIEDRRLKAYRSLFKTTSINKEQSDYQASISEAYREREHHNKINKASAIISYYCNIDSNEEIFHELLDVLGDSDLIDTISTGQCDFLNPMIVHLYDTNNYSYLLKLIKNLKGIRPIAEDIQPHAFLLTNGVNLTLLKNFEKITITEDDNQANYSALIHSLNISNSVAISLLGEKDPDVSYYEESRKGTPPIQDNLDGLAEAVTNHFKLDDGLYDELSALTLCPSHSFPIQRAYSD